MTEEQGDILTVDCRESRPNGFEHNTFTFVECIKVIRKLPILMMAFLQHIDETGRNGSCSVYELRRRTNLVHCPGYADDVRQIHALNNKE